MPIAPASTIDAYIALQPEEDIKGLEEIRSIIRSVAPEAKEMISYQMPAFHYHGMLVGFANWKKHYGFYPWNSVTVETFREALAGFETSKGAIRFPKNQPLPAALIRKLVKARMKDNLQKEKKTIAAKKHISTPKK